MYTSIYLHGCMYVFMYAYTCLRIHVCKFIYTNSRHLSANNARKRKPIASKSQRKSINRSVWREARGRRCTCKRFCVRERYEWGGVTAAGTCRRTEITDISQTLSCRVCGMVSCLFIYSIRGCIVDDCVVVIYASVQWATSRWKAGKKTHTGIALPSCTFLEIHMAQENTHAGLT